MNYILDTCVISELVKTQPNKAVSEWISQQEEYLLFLSVLTLAELQKGISRLPDGAKKEKLTHWLEGDFKSRFSERLLSIDENVASMWGKIQAEAERKGKTLPTVDGLIAATAQVRQATLVTRNVSDFAATNVPILNPWAAKG